jgi:outer membrane protein TolC
MKCHIVVFLCLLCPLFAAVPTQAQEILTLEEAVRITLENNYDIRLYANEVSINRNNISLANAGILPSLNGVLTTNNAIQNSRQIQANGNETVRTGARNSSFNYGVNLNWTLFNGFQMFARYAQLKAIRDQSEANFQTAVVTAVSDVIRGYYDLVQQQQQISANDTAIRLSRYRLQIASTRYEIGTASKLEVLNAKVDLNTDTTIYLNQLALYKNAKIRLNELMARDVTVDFRIVDTILINEQLTLEPLLQIALQQNPTLQSVLIGKQIAELNLRQVKGQRFPVIGVNSGYNFTDSRSALGFATQNTGRGFNYGVNASVPIFNGFLQRRNEQNAKILVANANLQYEQLELNVRSQLSSAYQTYLTNVALVSLEESNVDIAKQNMDITLDKFKYGNITPLEFREAQRNYVNAVVRFSNAQLQAKLAEISLKQLSGNINL